MWPSVRSHSLAHAFEAGDDLFGAGDRRAFEHAGDASPPVTRSIGWSSQSKKRRWISSASQPP
jgi:hypothetical protein